MRRGTVQRLVIAAALGTVTNVMVTVLCVYRAPAGSETVHWLWDRGDGYFGIWTRGGPGKAIYRWYAHGRTDPRTLGVPHVTTRAISSPPRGSTLRSAYWTSAIAEKAASGGGSRIDVAYGWPCLSFRGGYTETFGGPATAGIVHDVEPHLDEMVIDVVRNGKAVQITDPRPTPLIPVWPGVVVNSVLFGAAWYGLLLIPASLRRGRRRRRGACVECGYDRRGIAPEAACPECGTSA